MRSKRWVMVVIGLALLVGGGLLLRSRMAARTGVAHPAAAGASAAQAQRPVSVVVAPVVRRDVPVFLEGLGSASALHTVTVKTQLDGRLDRVLFEEGQAVKRGQVLAQIDPRPYQIQLQQAQGALARDQAQLTNARLTVGPRPPAHRRQAHPPAAARHRRGGGRTAGGCGARGPRRPSPRHASASTTRASPRPSTASPASARSTPETSCAPPMLRASCWSPRSTPSR